MTNYFFINTINGEMVFLNSKYGQQIWTLIKLRKDAICAEMNIKIPKGSMAYRPITNGYNRMERISELGMETIMKTTENQ